MTSATSHATAAVAVVVGSGLLAGTLIAGSVLLVQTILAPTPEHVERRAVFEKRLAGSTVARVCPDGTYLRRGADGGLFVAHVLGLLIVDVSSPLAEAC